MEIEGIRKIRPVKGSRGCAGILHAHVAALVVDVILPLGVHVLHVHLTVHQRGEGADEVTAGGEDVKHGNALPVKGQAVVELSLPRHAGVVGLVPVDPLPLHELSDGFAAVSLVDGGIGYAVDPAPHEIGVFGLAQG